MILERSAAYRFAPSPPPERRGRPLASTGGPTPSPRRAANGAPGPSRGRGRTGPRPPGPVLVHTGSGEQGAEPPHPRPVEGRSCPTTPQYAGVVDRDGTSVLGSPSAQGDARNPPARPQTPDTPVGARQRGPGGDEHTLGSTCPRTQPGPAGTGTPDPCPRVGAMTSMSPSATRSPSTPTRAARGAVGPVSSPATATTTSHSGAGTIWPPGTRRCSAAGDCAPRRRRPGRGGAGRLRPTFGWSPDRPAGSAGLPADSSSPRCTRGSSSPPTARPCRRSSLGSTPRGQRVDGQEQRVRPGRGHPHPALDDVGFPPVEPLGLRTPGRDTARR